MQDPKPSAFARDYLNTVARVLESLSAEDVGKALDVLVRAHAEGRQVFLIGNGGSAATASHMANDLTWGMTRGSVTAFRAISLADNVPLMTAIANDSGYEHIFSSQLETLAHRGDVVIAISGSGNSPNVLRALEVAKKLELTTVGFLGMDGGQAKRMVDVAVVVPAKDYGPIEDVHMVLDHLAMAYLRKALAK